MMKKVFILITTALLYRHCVLGDLEVTLSSGSIRGYERTSPNGRTFHAFQGIPFGKPPVGKLRFLAPEPVEPWSGVLDATKEPNICYSVNKDYDLEDEDCLYLNVFTPVLDRKNSDLLPVMVFIYGGGFIDGNTSYGVYGPDYLVEQDVLFVSLNYRLGPFGFLSTLDEVVPGNAALKDQVLALMWVRENIEQFGGDPEKVTIFGQSAGAASVGLLVLSKMATGLFRAAIAESGSAISNWAYLQDPVPLSYQLANLINSSVSLSNSQELLDYLQSVPAKEIDLASKGVVSGNYRPLPVIEVEHEGAFLTESWYGLLERGDFNRVPLFIGVNSEEYLKYAADAYVDATKEELRGYDLNSKAVVPASMNIVDEDVLETVAGLIKNIYIRDGGAWVDNLGYSIAYLSETHFVNPSVRHAQLQSQYTDVFFYKFSYAGNMGETLRINLEGAEKVCHSEELFYYFKRSMRGYDSTDLTKFSDQDVLTHDRMVKLWTNFAKYLNPTPEEDELLGNVLWPKMEPDSVNYVDIDVNLTVKDVFKEGRYDQWKGIFEEYGVKPFVVW